MKIEIIGSGCPKCLKLEVLIKEIVAKHMIDAEIIHVSDINQIVSYGVMMTPALVVDGEVKITGKLPSEDEILKMIRQ